MKNLFYLLLAATLFACSSQDGTLENNQPQDNPAPAGKYYSVALDLQGEVADFTVSQAPKWRANRLTTSMSSTSIPNLPTGAVIRNMLTGPLTGRKAWW